MPSFRNYRFAGNRSENETHTRPSAGRCRCTKNRGSQSKSPNGKCGLPKATIEFGNESRYIRASNWPRKQVALHRMHSGRCDEFLLFDCFDALGNDLQSQSAAYAHDCMDDCRVNRRADVGYETAIDFDRINRETTQGCQARISSAKVIECKRHAAVM